MLEIKNTEVFGLERAIKASGNAKSVGEINTKKIVEGMKDDTFANDHKRAKNLGSANVGEGHDHYLLGIHVQFDILYPQYWTIEAERYHNFEIITSQSKMHRLTTMGKDEDFDGMFNKYVDLQIIEIVKFNIDIYNHLQTYKQQDNKTWIHEETEFCVPRTTEELNQEKYEQFMRCVSNLPMGFELRMTCDLTYLQLKTIYFQRRNHKLKEDWGNFCDWCETLPMFKELIGIDK